MSPIDAIFDESGVGANKSPDYRPALATADLIIGVDVMSRHEFLVYGRDRLDRIIRTGKKVPLRALRIELDQATDELEKLCVAVELIRGRHDYNRPSRHAKAD